MKKLKSPLRRAAREILQAAKILSKGGYVVVISTMAEPYHVQAVLEFAAFRASHTRRKLLRQRQINRRRRERKGAQKK